MNEGAEAVDARTGRLSGTTRVGGRQGLQSSAPAR